MRAQLVAAAVLNDPDLTRVCDQDPLFAGGSIPDFISRRHVVEVKELTSRPLRRFIAAYDALPQRHIRVPGFRQLWAVSVDVSAAARRYDGNPETPVVKTLIATLTQMIEDLESRGITDSFADHATSSDTRKRLAESATTPSTASHDSHTGGDAADIFRPQWNGTAAS